MRLGLLIYGDLEIISGGFLYDRMLVRHLRRQGEEVEVISVPWRPYAWGLLDNLSPSLQRRLTRASFDLLLQDELIHPSCFWLNRRLGGQRPFSIVAIVHHLRGSEARPAWQNRLYLEVERQYLASVDGLICSSQATLEAVRGLMGHGKPNIVAHPGGDHFPAAITPEQISARALAPGPLEIMFLGNLIPRKGLHILLSALQKLPPQDWRLTVVGSLTMDPAYVRAIHRQMAQEGLGDRVALLGALVDEELARCLARSHLLAVPSSYEGFGIVYLEGMGFGLPAIASTAGGAREIISHGQDGFLVAPGDAAGLAGCVSRLARDRQLLRAMSLAARARYQAHPTWAASLAPIHRFLKGFVA
jgi:glycosyltransferase involved in cell wall biosynthesis